MVCQNRVVNSFVSHFKELAHVKFKACQKCANLLIVLWDISNIEINHLIATMDTILCEGWTHNFVTMDFLIISLSLVRSFPFILINVLAILLSWVSYNSLNLLIIYVTDVTVNKCHYR